jgi:ABC-type transport system involved in multi-copper enzyme maturation permease subunit
MYGLGLHFIQAEFEHQSAIRAVNRTAQAQGINLLLVAGLYVVNFLCIAIAALISADSLAGEIQSGTIQAVMTKPIRRSEVVLGKWLGHAGLLLLYLFFMGGGVLLIVRILSGYGAPNWPLGLALIYLNCLTILSVTLAFSSTLTTLATGGAVFGAYGVAFIGGWVERIGGFLQNQTATELGIFSSLLLPSEALWNKAASLMTTKLMNLMPVTPFTSATEPSTLMLIYSGVYLLAALAIAIRQFGKRDL